MTEEVVIVATNEEPAHTPVPVVPAEGDPNAQNVAAQAPATPPGEVKPATQDPAEKKGQSRFERRISRLTRDAAEAKARADFYEAEFKKAQPAPQRPTSEPRIEDFADVEEYAKAKAEYAKEAALKERDAKSRTDAQQASQKRLVSDWEKKAERGDSKYDDFADVVGELKPNSPWAVAVMEADNGDDIAHYLGTHIDEAEKIAALPPVAQIRAIGRLEAKLAAEPPKPKEPSKAPAPIAPLTGAAGVTPSEGPSDKDDMGTWMKKRQKQVHGR